MRGRRPLALLLSAGLLVAACSSDDSSSSPDTTAPPAATASGALVTAGDGLVPDDVWRKRQDDYLAFATADGQPNPQDVNSVLAFAERTNRDPSFTWDASLVGEDAFANSYELLEAFGDTGDFHINRMLTLYLRGADQLPAATAEKLKQQFLSFKYWWTEPTPEGIIDDQYYWTENHLIIFAANEYVAGQAFPDEVFTNSGMTGREHMAHAAANIATWVDLRARFGYSEWLSDVYANEDLMGVLLLAEFAGDPAIATPAAMALDLLLYDMASHLHDGNYGATHGRSYMKDKMEATDQDTYDTAQMLWPEADDEGFDNVDNTALVATAAHYRAPGVLDAVAASDEVSVSRARAGIPLDPTEPITPDPEPAYGLAYDDLMVWWSMGAQFAWQVVPLSVDTIETYGLWETANLQQAADLKPVVDGSDMDQLQSLALQLGPGLNPGLLSEVNTYTWRSPAAMLSTAQDWRQGQRSEQGHISQATLSADAIVFPQHPYDPVPDDPDWYTNSGWWTGEGAVPRAVQHENVAVSMYSPRFESAGGALAFIAYEPYTHAYFPQDRFDEVVQRDGWTFGRVGDSYVALWSWRPAAWSTLDPQINPTKGMSKPFELLADGGPDNVWLTEVGDASMWTEKADGGDPFAAFVDAVAAAPVTVTRTPPAFEGGPFDGFAVDYTSPTIGSFVVAQTGPLTVDGTAQSLDEYPRYDDPWSQVPFASTSYTFAADGWSLSLDFPTGTRTATRP